jgi:hypothetical protein
MSSATFLNAGNDAPERVRLRQALIDEGLLELD